MNTRGSPATIALLLIDTMRRKGASEEDVVARGIARAEDVRVVWRSPLSDEQRNRLFQALYHPPPRPSPDVVAFVG